MDYSDIDLVIQKLIEKERNAELHIASDDSEEKDTSFQEPAKGPDQDSQYKCPPCSYAGLVRIILRNTEMKALTISAIADIMSQLFPHFSTVKGLPCTIWRAVYSTMERDSFLTNDTSCRVRDRLVILNPAVRKVEKKKNNAIYKRIKANSLLYMRKPELLDVLLEGNAKLDTWLRKETNCKEDVTSDQAVDAAINANNDIVSASSIASLLPEVHVGQETVNASSQILLELDENRQGDMSCEQTNTYSTNSESLTSVPYKEKKTEGKKKIHVKCKRIYIRKINTCVVIEDTVKPVTSHKVTNTDLGGQSVSFVQDVNQNDKLAESLQGIVTSCGNVHIPDRPGNHISGDSTANCAINTDTVTKMQYYSDEGRKRCHTKENNHSKDDINTDNVIFSQTQDSQLPVITSVVSIAGSIMDEMCSEEDNRENEMRKDIDEGKIQEKKKSNLKRFHDSSQTTVNSDSKSQADGHPKRRKNAVNEVENTVKSMLSEAVPGSQVKKMASVMPELSGCIKNWQKVFPWVTYCCEKQTLICENCKWGSTDPVQFEVFVLTNPSKVFQTAKMLRCHDESPKHRELVVKKLQIQKLFRHIYSLLKGNMKEVSGLEGITERISYLEGGIFPGPQKSPEKEYIVSYMVKHIAICLQNRQLESLEKSPYFSVLAFEKNSLAIMRWINQSGESEEHLLCFCGKSQNEELTLKQYLKYKQVDLQKMSFCADIPHMRNIGSLDTLALPARLPSLKKCLSWLEDKGTFKDLFHYLETFTKLCKASQFMFANFPETEEILQLEEPYGHNCLKSASILNFFSKNFLKLQEIAYTIYKETGSLEALEFSSLDITHQSAFKIAEAVFPRLHSVFAKKEHNQSSITEITALRKFVASMFKHMDDQESEDLGILSIIDIFLSYALLSLQSYLEETMIFFTMRLQQVTTFTMEKVFEKFMKEFKGRSCELLQDIHAVRTLLGKKKSCTVLDLLEAFGEKPDMCDAYPKLHEVYLKVKVLPFTNAKVELSMFDVALAYGTLIGNFSGPLVMAMAYISIEGPSPKDIDEDYIMREWSDKWKASRYSLK